MKNHPPRTITRRVVAGVAVGAFVLAACGSDSNDADDAAESAATEAVDEAESAVTEAMEEAETADTEAMEEAETADTEAMEEDGGTIVDVAVEAGTFETLVAAVTAADLVETLSGEGPFTVFAPTDDAFAALPDGLVDALLLPENADALTAILTYHVIPAEVPSSEVAPGDVETVQGETVTITADVTPSW